MTPDKRDSLQRDLERIAVKHGLVDCAFCGTEDETKEFIGFAVDSKTTMLTGWKDVLLNIARLWQCMKM